MSKTNYLRGSAAVITLTTLAACSGSQAPAPAKTDKVDAATFIAGVNKDLVGLNRAINASGWVQSTYITPDTEQMAAQANEALVNAATRYARDASRFDKVTLPAAERRQMDVLKNSLTMSAPPNPKESEELTQLMQKLRDERAKQKTSPPPAV